MKTSFNHRLQEKSAFRFDKNIFLLVIIFLILSYFASAQTDFRPGYYITWENDTVYGLIDYRGEIRNSGFCSFKENETSEPVRFEPGEIKAYRFAESKYYISKKIKVDNEEKQVFVEFLLYGIINLYFYRDINNYMYLIEGENGRIIELTNEKDTEYVAGKGETERKTHKYIGQLKATLADCKEIQDEIENVVLEHASLIHITKEYHDYMCDDEQCIIYAKQVKKSKVKIAPVIGGGISSLHFDKGEFSNYSFNNSLFPMIGLLIHISLPKWNEKLSMEIETDFSKPDFQGAYIDDHSSFKTDYYNAQINVISFQPSVALKYTFGKSKIKPTLAAGIYSNFLISPDEKVTKKSVHTDAEYNSETNETPLASNVFGVLLQAGCDFELKNQTLFSNIRICQTALKEAGVSTFINSANMSIGMYLSKN